MLGKNLGSMWRPSTTHSEYSAPPGIVDAERELSAVILSENGVETKGLMNESVMLENLYDHTSR